MLQQVLDEKKELDNKINTLENFIDSNPLFENLDFTEQDDLIVQLKHMKEYSYALARRISRF